MVRCPVCNQEQLNEYMAATHLLSVHGWTKQRADEYVEKSLFGFVDRLKETFEQVQRDEMAARFRRAKPADVE